MHDGRCGCCGLGRWTCSSRTAPRCSPCRDPTAIGRHLRFRLGPDYCVRVAGSDYCVDPTAIGQMVDIVADLEHVTVSIGGRVIARHARSSVSAATVIDPAHVAVAARLRTAFQQPREVEDPPARDLADYDRAFGSASTAGRLMAGDAVKEIAYCHRAEGAQDPRHRRSAGGQARDGGWSHEDYLAAVLERGSPPARLRAALGSARPGSPPARRWMNSCSTTSQVSAATTWAPLAARALPDRGAQYHHSLLLSSPTRSAATPQLKRRPGRPKPHALVPAELIADLQVWRAATQVDPGDLRSTGPPQLGRAARILQQQLDKGLAAPDTNADRQWRRLSP